MSRGQRVHGASSPNPLPDAVTFRLRCHTSDDSASAVAGLWKTHAGWTNCRCAPNRSCWTAIPRRPAGLPGPETNSSRSWESWSPKVRLSQNPSDCERTANTWRRCASSDWTESGNVSTRQRRTPTTPGTLLTPQPARSGGRPLDVVGRSERPSPHPTFQRQFRRSPFRLNGYVELTATERFRSQVRRQFARGCRPLERRERQGTGRPVVIRRLTRRPRKM